MFARLNLCDTGSREKKLGNCEINDTLKHIREEHKKKKCVCIAN